MSIVETAARRLLGGKVEELEETAEQQAGEIWRLEESMQRLEQLLYSDEWRRYSVTSGQEFSRDGLRQMTELARLMKLKNPVIKRGVEVQRLYVWAQGVAIRAADEEINALLQAFLDDERNRAELTTHQARGEKEEQLQTDGNLFLRFFINPDTGRVRVRTIDPQEVDDIVCNPDDKHEPWFYRRTYIRNNLDGSTSTVREAYPDWRYIPRSRLAGTAVRLGETRIDWGTPVYHVAVNKSGRWGVPEFYAAMDWALAYKRFLENLAGVWQALARFAWYLNTRGGKRGVAAAKTKLGTTLDSGAGETNPPPVTGSTFISSEGVNLQPFRTSGATMSAEDGRRLMLMAIATMGFPETFYGDVSVGTLATASSLDRPTELKIRDRQSLWEDVHQNIFGFVLLWAVKAPGGPLRSLGKFHRERDGDEFIEYVEWNEGVNPAVDIDFPPVIDIDNAAYIGSLVDATTLKGQLPAGTFNLETFTRLAAVALGVQDVDALMDDLFPADEEPEMPAETAEEREAVMQSVQQLLSDLREAVKGNGQPA